MLLLGIFAAQVRKKDHPYTKGQYINSFVMMLALLWLTVSTPFVYKAQQKQQEVYSQATGNSQHDNSGDPFANTTEEKAPGTINLSEEYLHHTDRHEHPWCSIITHHRDYSSSLYVAWHGEPLCPPPNA